jgi:hypothetical protein
MVTRSKHGQPTEPKSIATEQQRLRPETPCPRLRFFVETRKRDDGDAMSARKWKALVLKLSAAVREADACGRKPPASIMNNAG